jgi:hypothetical protein
MAARAAKGGSQGGHGAGVAVWWMTEPESQDSPTASAYLSSLVAPQRVVERLAAALRMLRPGLRPAGSETTIDPAIQPATGLARPRPSLTREPGGRGRYRPSGREGRVQHRRAMPAGALRSDERPSAPHGPRTTTTSAKPGWAQRFRVDDPFHRSVESIFGLQAVHRDASGHGLPPVPWCATCRRGPSPAAPACVGRGQQTGARRSRRTHGLRARSAVLSLFPWTPVAGAQSRSGIPESWWW